MQTGRYPHGLGHRSRLALLLLKAGGRRQSSMSASARSPPRHTSPAAPSIPRPLAALHDAWRRAISSCRLPKRTSRTQLPPPHRVKQRSKSKSREIGLKEMRRFSWELAILFGDIPFWILNADWQRHLGVLSVGGGSMRHAWLNTAGHAGNNRGNEGAEEGRERRKRKVPQQAKARGADL